MPLDPPLTSVCTEAVVWRFSVFHLCGSGLHSAGQGWYYLLCHHSTADGLFLGLFKVLYIFSVCSIVIVVCVCCCMGCYLSGVHCVYVYLLLCVGIPRITICVLSCHGYLGSVLCLWSTTCMLDVHYELGCTMLSTTTAAAMTNSSNLINTVAGYKGLSRN